MAPLALALIAGGALVSAWHLSHDVPRAWRNPTDPLDMGAIVGDLVSLVPLGTAAGLGVSAAIFIAGDCRVAGRALCHAAHRPIFEGQTSDTPHRGRRP